jgi:hypothetical protein
MTAVVDAAFNDLISAWDEPLRCQTAQGPRPCRNPATWLAVLHQPCGQKVLCAYHYGRWLRTALTHIAERGRVGCSVCPRYFATVEQFGRFQRW